MTNISNKIIELDLYQLVKVLLSGIWIILTFFILGFLIGYIYETNYAYEEGDVQYIISIPIYELGSIDRLRLNELNNNIKKLYLLEYEKSLLNYKGVSTSGKMVSQFDTIVSSRIEGFLEKNLRSDKFTEPADVDTSEFLTTIYQDTRKDYFKRSMIDKYNSLIENKYKGSQEKIKNYKLSSWPIVEGEITDVRGLKKYNFTLKFSEKVRDENINDFAKETLIMIRERINEQLRLRYKIAEENYFKELESIKSSLAYLIQNLRRDLKIAITTKMESLKFQRDIAFDLDYEKPQPAGESGITDKSILGSILDDNFLIGYLYLNKRIQFYETKTNEDFENFVPQLTFYKNTFNELSRNVTLTEVKDRLTRLGLFDNKFKVFDSAILNEFSASREREDVSHTIVINQIPSNNTYATIYCAIIGLVLGIFITFLNFFYRNRNKENS